MAKKKPITTYKIGGTAGVVLIRETLEENSFGQTQRRTSFLGVIYDRSDAEKICEALNGKKRK